MSNQKSRKEYQHVTKIPREMNLNESESKLEICLWHHTGECAGSGLRNFVNRPEYDGIKCKCYAYIPKGDKK